MPTSHAFSIRANDIRLCRKREGKIWLMKSRTGCSAGFCGAGLEGAWAFGEKGGAEFLAAPIPDVGGATVPQRRLNRGGDGLGQQGTEELQQAREAAARLIFLQHLEAAEAGLQDIRATGETLAGAGLRGEAVILVDGNPLSRGSRFGPGSEGHPVSGCRILSPRENRRGQCSHGAAGQNERPVAS